MRTPKAKRILKVNHKMVQILSVEQLKDLATGGVDCFIALNGNCRSSKTISYDRSANEFYVENLIDDSSQVLTEEELFTDSNIGEAITKGALYADS